VIYVPGLTVGQLSGRAGNTVARANPNATTIGVHRPRRQPLTPNNQLARASFSDISILYKTLTSGQLLDWAALGQDIEITGRLDRTFALSGRTAFFQVNRNLFAIGQPYVVDAPAIDIPSSPADLAGDAVTEPTATPLLELTFTPDPIDADTTVIISATRPLSSSVLAFPVSGWKQLALADDGDTGPYDITAAYLSRFGSWHVGNQIGLQVVTVNYAGFASVKNQLFITST